MKKSLKKGRGVRFHMNVMQVQQEENILKGIFPEEIWMMILNYIKGSEDRLNCAMASPFLKRLLDPYRTIYLFAKVLKQLEKTSALQATETCSLPEISRSLLSCRPVCKAWDEAITSMLQSRPYHYKCRENPSPTTPLPVAALEDPTLYTRLPLFSLSLTTLLEEVLPALNGSPQIFRKHGLCPSRHLFICEFRRRELRTDAFRQKYSNVEDYRSTIEEVLMRVGHHFWHVTIEIRDSLSLVGGHDQIWKYLCLLPNVKSIYISWEKRGVHNYVTSGNDLIFHPFKNFPNLIYASFQNAPLFTIASVLATNPHVKKVEIVIPHVENVYSDWYVVMARITGLKQLSMEINRPEELLILPDNWKLRFLRLVVKCNAESLSMSTLVNKMRQYAGSLTYLHVVLPEEGASQMEEEQITEAHTQLIAFPKLRKLIFHRSCGDE